jgi:hypothetical protein
MEAGEEPPKVPEPRQEAPKPKPKKKVKKVKVPHVFEIKRGSFTVSFD